ncbi:DUF975 family protein [Butyrivibrio sp. WCD2001]|uniref:DUF975 family protein n=1 Tax=Butyrivibrio sp. WCD2001 TaxID=1280681 RepID=UPI000420A167|nr:DUF975 family protein [Butyrivibrio sp. WCD2001]
MWTNSLLKQNGKLNMKKNYWYCVVASVVLGICVGGSSGGSAYNSTQNSASSSGSWISEIDPAIITAILGAAGIAIIIGIIIKIALFNPLEVGCQKFFIMNRVEPKAELGYIAFGLKNNWKNVVKTMFLTHLFQALWTLLFIIPGIIKGYSYRLVPYIMAENPDMDSNDAITLSRSMMNGQKMNAFIYDLSFLGWIILTLFTCGILGIFYVGPYKACSDAELYTAIKENYNPQNTVLQ